MSTQVAAGRRSGRGKSPRRPSTLRNRNVTVAGHRTSIRLEPVVWEAVRNIAEREGKTLNQLVTEIASSRVQSSLTAAIRVYVVIYFRSAATDEGHRRAGHGVGPPPLND